MAGQKVRHVTMTNDFNGVVYQGVQDIDTGIVYPFIGADVCVEVVEDVNAGKADIEDFGPLHMQGLYTIAEVS